MEIETAVTFMAELAALSMRYGVVIEGGSLKDMSQLLGFEYRHNIDFSDIRWEPSPNCGPDQTETIGVPKRWLSIPEIQDYAQCSKNIVGKAMSSGELRYEARGGGRRYALAPDVIKWVDGRNNNN